MSLRVWAWDGHYLQGNDLGLVPDAQEALKLIRGAVSVDRFGTVLDADGEAIGLVEEDSGVSPPRKQKQHKP